LHATTYVNGLLADLLELRDPGHKLICPLDASAFVQHCIQYKAVILGESLAANPGLSAGKGENVACGGIERRACTEYQA